MSKSIELLKQAVLTDSEGGRSRVINVRGKEAGLDHLEITTQSAEEREQGIATRHRIYTEEIVVS